MRNDITVLKDVDGCTVVISNKEISNALTDEGCRLFGFTLETIASMRHYFLKRNFPVSDEVKFREMLND